MSSNGRIPLLDIVTLPKRNIPIWNLFLLAFAVRSVTSHMRSDVYGFPVYFTVITWDTVELTSL